MTFYYEDADKVVAHNAEVMVDGDAMFVKAGVVIGSNTDWDGVEGASNGSFQVYGTIMSVGGTGLHAAGGANFLQIGVGGAIVGSTHFGAGLAIEGNGTRIFNDGTISGAVGIDLDGGGAFEIVNSGYIHGVTDVAVHLGNSAGTFTNTGVISSSDDFAIRIDTLNSGFLALYNSGTIAGGDLFSGAIYMGDGTGPAFVTNTGEMDGNVKLGPDDDTFDGSLGRLNGVLYGNLGDDILTTGAGRDVLSGGPGADILDGGAGRDLFAYDFRTESTGLAHDTIIGFDARKDTISISGVTGVDHAFSSGALRTAHFDTDLAAAVTAAHLQSHHAVLWTPGSGDYAGHTILVVDANGTAGYQANKDFVIDLVDADNLSLHVSSFGG